MEEPPLGDILAQALNKQEVQMNAVTLNAKQLVNLANFVITKVGADRKIDCIKELRYVTGLALKEAKDIIELVIDPPYSESPIVAAVREEVRCRRGEWNHIKWTNVG
jgi:hypothetical protein